VRGGRVYNKGKRVARRSTGPEVDEPEPGDPERFAKYAKKGAVERLRKILADKPVFAEETAYAIGVAFGVGRKRVEFSHAWAAHGDVPPPGAILVTP
jgi:hypothetical protein